MFIDTATQIGIAHVIVLGSIGGWTGKLPFIADGHNILVILIK